MQAAALRINHGKAVAEVANQLPAQKALAAGAFLCVLQAADGLLTSVGMARFGTSMEGNPLLRHLMETLGHIPALTLVKALAILVVIAMTMQARRLPWIQNAMGALSCVYMLLAIMPWTYILFIKPYIS
jgi:hypothetical protein